MYMNKPIFESKCLGAHSHPSSNFLFFSLFFLLSACIYSQSALPTLCSTLKRLFIYAENSQMHYIPLPSTQTTPSTNKPTKKRMSLTHKMGEQRKKRSSTLQVKIKIRFKYLIDDEVKMISSKCARHTTCVE